MTVVIPGENDGKEKWRSWLADNTSQSNDIDEDFGLYRVAKHFGKTEAVEIYWLGAKKESEGDINGAIQCYRRAYRQWPELDSVTYGGLPRGVREIADKAGLAGFLDVIDVACAQASSVVFANALLSTSDIDDVEAVRRHVASVESLKDNNPQNATHAHKVATFLNNPPAYPMICEAPHVVGKLVNFAARAWEEGNWSGPNGPLRDVSGGISSLSLRVIEHWEYQVGGGLVDPLHYDVDSILTIVALLAGDHEGGVFRTYEPGDIHSEHPMNAGDAICFVSHKFHNITPLTQGTRRSLVIEMWQGGCSHMGR